MALCRPVWAQVIDGLHKNHKKTLSRSSWPRIPPLRNTQTRMLKRDNVNSARRRRRARNRRKSEKKTPFLTVKNGPLSIRRFLCRFAPLAPAARLGLRLWVRGRGEAAEEREGLSRFWDFSLFFFCHNLPSSISAQRRSTKKKLLSSSKWHKPSPPRALLEISFLFMYGEDCIIRLYVLAMI